MTRATKKIVAEWIALEDQDDDENDEEEVNDEDEGGQNFGVSEVYELFWFVIKSRNYLLTNYILSWVHFLYTWLYETLFRNKNISKFSFFGVLWVWKVQKR